MHTRKTREKNDEQSQKSIPAASFLFALFSPTLNLKHITITSIHTINAATDPIVPNQGRKHVLVPPSNQSVHNTTSSCSTRS